MKGQITVRCPECGQQGIIKASALQDRKVVIRCARCHTRFSHMIDRRSYRRRVPYPPLRFGPFDFDFKKLLQTGELLDISMNGLRFQTRVKDPPHQNERISIAFTLPNTDTPIRIGAEVVWLRHAEDGSLEVGTRFFYISDHDKQAIGFYLMP